MNESIVFFETQFARQVARQERELNPFEALALPFLHGQLLDYGCGLGNLSLAAARQGCTVTALDAAPTAIAHLTQLAVHEGLPVQAQVADLRDYAITDSYDSVVAIGLLMFFDQRRALAQLEQLKQCVRPGGIAVVNVLVAGTSYYAMFGSGDYYLFGRDELRRAFAGWDILSETEDSFPAPGNTHKCFVTVVARSSAS